MLERVRTGAADDQDADAQLDAARGIVAAFGTTEETR